MTKCTLEVSHGAPGDESRHVGDLGNIEADMAGVATIDMMDHWLSLNGINSIIGRGVVIHAGRDDLGQVSDDDPDDDNLSALNTDQNQRMPQTSLSPAQYCLNQRGLCLSVMLISCKRRRGHILSICNIFDTSNYGVLTGTNVSGRLNRKHRETKHEISV